MKNSISFTDIGDIEHKLDIIKYHTHWGKLLMNMKRKGSQNGNISKGDIAKAKFASTLLKRIKFFLEGK